MYRYECGELQTTSTMLNTELKNCESKIKFLEGLANSLEFNNAFLKKKIDEDYSKTEELRKQVEDLQQQLDGVVDRSTGAYITFQEVIVKQLEKCHLGQKF